MGGARLKEKGETEEQRGGGQGGESMKGKAGETGAEGGEVTRKEVGETEGHGGDCGSSGAARGGLPASEPKDKAGAWIWGTGTPWRPGAFWQELGTMPLPLCPPPQQLSRLPGNQSSLLCLLPSLFLSLPFSSLPPSSRGWQEEREGKPASSPNPKPSSLLFRAGHERRGSECSPQTADGQIFIIFAPIGPRKSTRESSKSISAAHWSRHLHWPTHGRQPGPGGHNLSPNSHQAQSPDPKLPGASPSASVPRQGPLGRAAGLQGQAQGRSASETASAPLWTSRTQAKEEIRSACQGSEEISAWDS